MIPEVWAPFASAVAVVIDGHGPTPLRAATRGWFAGTDRLDPGTRYRFVLDDGDPVPDPRSAWQPDGVHGPSVVVDHDAYEWPETEASWQPPAWPDAVVYELHLGTFSPDGTYRGAEAMLDHLVDLGITHVELMPIAAYAGRYGWGYDGVDLFAPHPAYGTPDELRHLVATFHEKGLAVLLDVVYNHLGPEGNYLGRFGPYFTDRYHTPWGDAVNLDGPGSEEVRRFFIDNARHWVTHYHVDGLRLDAVHALLDTSARHFLEELATAMGQESERLGRSIVLVAESDRNDPRLVRPVEDGGYALDAHWCDDIHHSLHVFLTGERDGYYEDYEAARDNATLLTALQAGYVYEGQHSAARDSLVGRPPVGLRGRNLIAALQNHDQIGNRARGERLGHLASVRSVQAAAALLLIAPFVPLLFQGEEWNATAPFPYFADHDDPELAAAIRTGRRHEFTAFGWRPEDVLDPESEETFFLAKLDWSERTSGDHAVMLAWYRDLLALRHSASSDLDDSLLLTGPEPPAGYRVAADADGLLVTLRRGPLFVACNFSGDDAELELDGRPEILLTNDEPSVDGPMITLPAHATAVGRIH